MSSSPNLYRRAAIVCRQIPYGRAATYGQIALLCGMPKNSRQVGYGLKMGLLGPHVPAHRIVNSRGILSGAIHFDTPDLQVLLLREEGVDVAWSKEGWRVDLKQYGWNHTLAEAEAFRQIFQEQDI